MHVQLHIDEDGLRGWHRVLLRRLADGPGRTAEIVLCSGGLGRGRHRAAIGALLAVDRVTGRARGSPLAEPWPAAALRAEARAPQPADQATPVVLDLTDDGRVARGHREAWHLLYDGRTGESALGAALLAGRSPVASVEGPTGTRIAARLGTDRHGLFRARMEDALARTITVLVAAVEGAGSAVLPAGPDDAGLERWDRASSRGLPFLAAVGIGRAFATKARSALSRRRKWRVAWRSLQGGADSIEAGRPTDAHWHVLPDDGLRFYADPFPIVHEGRTTLFVEDFEHAAGRGVISAVRFGPDGPEGSPQVVLAEAHHLSYPFVFACDGALWMVPESSVNRTIDLYRAQAFPQGWVKAATLVRDVVASDATLLRHEGRWWLFATVKDGSQGASGSHSDALHIWWASHVTGRWTAHPANPVLIDAGSARPAGRFVARGDALIRPAQDCRRSYGGAVVLARVDRLDEGGFAQSLVGRIGPGRRWSRRGVHTLNRAGEIEVIDGFA